MDKIEKEQISFLTLNPDLVIIDHIAGFILLASSNELTFSTKSLAHAVYWRNKHENVPLVIHQQEILKLL